jgi:metal-dependent amidase/aminoacylase/carboxypeptidase family protein
MPVCGMKRSPEAAWERAMKIQEVMLRAMAKRITWWQAAEIIGISCRQMRRRAFPDLGVLLERAAGSTDMGNVSMALPAIHPFIGINLLPAVNHQPEFTAPCIKEEADQALHDGRSRWRGRR